VSVRALTIGVILAVVLILAAPYAGLVMNSQFLDTSYFPIGLGFPSSSSFSAPMVSFASSAGRWR